MPSLRVSWVKRGWTVHKDLRVFGDAERGNAGAAAEKLPVHYHVVDGMLEGVIGVEEVTVDQRHSASLFHNRLTVFIWRGV